MSNNVQIIDDAEFSTQVLNVDQPVLVYFWATWCGPCRLMAPIMDSLADQYGDQLKIVKLETDPNPAAVAQYQVEGLPAFRLFKAGAVVEAAEGAISKQKLQEMLDHHLAPVV